MLAVSEFIYKGVEKREGGEFINDKGQSIKYDASYVLKVDELTPEGIYEMKVKIDKNNTALVDKIKAKNFYDKIKLECEIKFSGSQARVIPVSLIER